MEPRRARKRTYDVLTVEISVEVFFDPVTVAVPSTPSFVVIPSVAAKPGKIAPFMINKITTKSKRAIQKRNFIPNIYLSLEIARRSRTYYLKPPHERQLFFACIFLNILAKDCFADMGRPSDAIDLETGMGGEGDL